MTPKRYDRAYFDRFYRDPRSRIWARADVARKVRLALAVAEYLLDRPVRSVLDVGCGEGAWQPVLARLRPRAHYQGIDASPYVVSRFGRRRNIRLGRLGDLASLGLRRRYDLVVCCDVLHYVPTAEVRRALTAMAALGRGPAYLEAYTSADAVDGDDAEFRRRSPAVYRRLFRSAGFTRVGPHCYVNGGIAEELVAFEKG